MLVAGTAGAQADEFGVKEGSFFAKTHDAVEHVPPPAAPDIDSGAIEALPTVTQAGAHPDATTSFSLNTREGPSHTVPFDNAREIVVDLPPGFAGNPNAAARCSMADLQVRNQELGSNFGGRCTPASQVGLVRLDYAKSGPVVTETFPVYNVDPAPGYPASLGFRIDGLIPVLINIDVRSDGDYGLEATVSDIATTRPVFASAVTVWGVPADPIHDSSRWNTEANSWGASVDVPLRPFTINPGNCESGPLPTTITARSWQDPLDWTDPITDFSPAPTGCESLNFNGSLDLQPEATEAESPTGFEVNLSLPYNNDPDGLARPMLRRAEVALPEGVTISPSAARGLEACTLEEIGLDRRSAERCPDASKLGTVEVETPVLDEDLTGHVYQAAPFDNPFDSLLAIYIVVEGSGVRIKLPGRIETDPETGQIVSTFDDNPQLPFTDMTLRFYGGEGAPLVTPSACGSYSTTAELTPWSHPGSGPPVVSESSFEITSGAGGGSCLDSEADRPFSPGFDAGTLNPAAGTFSTLLTRFTRTDGEQDLGSIAVDMPEGLVAKVADVPLCPSDRADAGTCAEGSRIGHVQIASGAGDRPYWVPGPGKDPTVVYLSGSYEGAPYSLSIVVEAQAGPFDLGRVVVRSPIEVDDRTTELSIDVAESRIFDRSGDLAQVIPGEMPTVLEGIPLKVKDVRVIVDRDEFIVNPTNCNPKQIRGVIESAEGKSAEVSQRFQAADCAALDFAPRFGMRILNRGRRSTLRSFNPAMRFGVAPRRGHANIAAAAVTLPSSIILDQSNIRTVCTRDQFASRECPQAAIYGFARAWSPLLKRPIQGPVYLGSSDNQLPDLIADMRGEVRVILQGEILGTSDGRIRNVFRFVPDVQVSRFQLTMFGGSNRGVLVNSRDLCRSPERGVTHFFGQNGKRQVSRHRVGLSFRGCRQVLRREAIRQAKRRRALRRAVHTGQMTPAQARRQIRT